MDTPPDKAPQSGIPFPVTQTEPQQLPAPVVPANPLIYVSEVTYPLSRHDFRTLTTATSSPLGYGLLSFAVPQLATVATSELAKPELQRHWLSPGSIIGVGALVLSLILLLVAKYFGRERRALTKEIKTLYRSTPPTHQVREGP